MSDLLSHLATGTTTIARCWRLTRADGVVMGFTDHDQTLRFDGTVFKADSGLSASAVTHTRGLSVDNTEALGALSDAAIREEDIAAGRFDGAEIEAWLVLWTDPEIRGLTFRGTLGEITRHAGAFTAELRGLADALNQPSGQTYHAACPRVLGDEKCGVDLSNAQFATEATVVAVEGGRSFRFESLESYPAKWFENGMVEALEGAAQGLIGVVKSDRSLGEAREVKLWAPLDATVEVGTRMRLICGCDKRMDTCRVKFNNLLNFRGFPDIPSDDWLVVHPSRASVLDGGSRR